MKRSYHEFCAVDDAYLHRHRLADDAPPAGLTAPSGLDNAPPSAVVFTAEVSPEPGKKHWLHIRLLRFSAQG